MLEGVLRICWGVEHSIRIKEFDDKRLIAKRSFKGKCNNRFHLITSKSVQIIECVIRLLCNYVTNAEKP